MAERRTGNALTGARVVTEPHIEAARFVGSLVAPEFTKLSLDPSLLTRRLGGATEPRVAPSGKIATSDPRLGMLADGIAELLQLAMPLGGKTAATLASGIIPAAAKAVKKPIGAVSSGDDMVEKAIKAIEDVLAGHDTPLAKGPTPQAAAALPSGAKPKDQVELALEYINAALKGEDVVPYQAAIDAHAAKKAPEQPPRGPALEPGSGMLDDVNVPGGVLPDDPMEALGAMERASEAPVRNASAPIFGEAKNLAEMYPGNWGASGIQYFKSPKSAADHFAAMADEGTPWSDVGAMVAKLPAEAAAAIQKELSAVKPSTTVIPKAAPNSVEMGQTIWSKLTQLEKDYLKNKYDSLPYREMYGLLLKEQKALDSISGPGETAALLKGVKVPVPNKLDPDKAIPSLNDSAIDAYMKANPGASITDFAPVKQPLSKAYEPYMGNLTWERSPGQTRPMDMREQVLTQAEREEARLAGNYTTKVYRGFRADENPTETADWMSRKNVYSTDNPHVADMYSAGQYNQRNVTPDNPAGLYIKNDVPDFTTGSRTMPMWLDTTKYTRYDASQYASGDLVAKTNPLPGHMGEAYEHAKTQALNMGAPGFIVHNVKDGPGLEGWAPASNVYVTLDPRTMKSTSATNFDPTSRNIMKTVGAGGVSGGLAIAWPGDEAQAAPSMPKMYHTSPANFERFDPAHARSGVGRGEFGPGAYVAENPLTMGHYYDSFRRAGVDSPTRYEVQPPGTTAQYIQFDRPISKQSPEVRRALEQAGITDLEARRQTALSGLGDPNVSFLSAEEAQRLRAAGVQGVRYLDAGSRGPGRGTYNAVVFDPASIDIMRKFGIGALMGAPAAGGVLLKDKDGL